MLKATIPVSQEEAILLELKCALPKETIPSKMASSESPAILGQAVVDIGYQAKHIGGISRTTSVIASEGSPTCLILFLDADVFGCLMQKFTLKLYFLDADVFCLLNVEIYIEILFLDADVFCLHNAGI